LPNGIGENLSVPELIPAPHVPSPSLRRKNMPTPHELEEKLWKALGSDMTMMLGLTGAEDSHMRPMTAQFENDRGPIWFFTAKSTGIANALANGQKAASGIFASKGHDIFAHIHGQLVIDNNSAVIDRLWNRFVAAWYEGGKDDPELTLLRFDCTEAEIWLDSSSLLAGVKMLLGFDPKKEYADNVATVALN
jgi:general stress protein 26